MKHGIIITTLAFGLAVLIACMIQPPRHTHIVGSVDNMRLVHDDIFPVTYSGIPIPQRGEAVKRWLKSGVQISHSEGSGSGTIIYYEESSGWAYVQSCGHLWSGNMTAAQGVQRALVCNIITWYHNDEKLSQPRKYKAQILYYSNDDGRDVSLLRFKPDWIPDYMPIAPEDYVFVPQTRFHSVGCDAAQEIAHYDVTFIGFNQGSWPDMVTTRNSPRPGRSGGGLLSEDGFFVAVCWGTTRIDGTGNGVFTPLKTVRAYNEKNGYGWLNDVISSLARQIPIHDRNNPQGEYPKDYIPLPKR